MSLRLKTSILSIALLAGCQIVVADECPGAPYVSRTDSHQMELYKCVGVEAVLMDQFPTYIFEPQIDVSDREGAASILVLNRSNNLAGDPTSVDVLVYELDSARLLLRANSSSYAEIYDRNHDGIDEVLLYGQIIQFDSLVLSSIGFPVIVELTVPISIGALPKYESIREDLERLATEWMETLTQACTFDGEFDPICGAATDIKKLRLMIEYLESMGD